MDSSTPIPDILLFKSPWSPFERMLRRAERLAKRQFQPSPSTLASYWPWSDYTWLPREDHPLVIAVDAQAVHALPPKEVVLLPPCDAQKMQPAETLIFNPPYTQQRIYRIKILNLTGQRIGWVIKTTNPDRLEVDPPNGVLDPKEAFVMALFCAPFDPAKGLSTHDRISILWVNICGPDGNTFTLDWFMGSKRVHRMNLPIDYRL